MKLNLKMSLVSVLVALLLPVVAFAQNITIKGTVSDANGDPIPGAYVAVRNTTTGTVTDIDGNSVFPAPPPLNSLSWVMSQPRYRWVTRL